MNDPAASLSAELARAARVGDHDRVQALLATGARPTPTTLQLAVFSANERVVEAILQASPSLRHPQSLCDAAKMLNWRSKPDWAPHKDPYAASQRALFDTGMRFETDAIGQSLLCAAAMQQSAERTADLLERCAAHLVPSAAQSLRYNERTGDAPEGSADFLLQIHRRWQALQIARALSPPAVDDASPDATDLGL